MKYIVDLPNEYVAGGQIDVPVSINGYTAWIKTGIVLIPYVESDTDACINYLHKQGWLQDHDKQITESEYKRGLNDAWEAARKIACDRPHGGFCIDTKQHIFGAADYAYILANYNASEAVEKICQYEQEKEEIKVGDEVQHRNHSDIKIIVLEKDGDVITAIAVTNVPFCCKVGDMYINRDVKDWERTGKHYVIAEVLKKLKEIE